MADELKEAKRPRLTAFVGRSFLKTDRGVWQELRDILDSLKPLGFDYEDAKEAQPRPVSEKVRELIIRNDFYIGVLTRRGAICDYPMTILERLRHATVAHAPTKWCTSEWVVEEIGFALGKDRPVVLLIEEGVVFPTADLDADTEWIPFRRSELTASQTSLTQIITNLIAKRVQSVSETVPAATVVPAEKEVSKEPPEPDFAAQLKELKAHVLANMSGMADRLQASIVEEENDPEDKALVDAMLLQYRAIHGDGTALVRLQSRVSKQPEDYHALTSLGDVYDSFKQFAKEAELFVSRLNLVEDANKTSLTLRASHALRKDQRAAEGIPLNLKRLGEEQDEQARTSLYREIAHIGQDLKSFDLEAAFLEKVIAIAPTDNDSRFRLAYLYSENNREKVAAHHYGIVVSHVNWPGARNNLGVTYGYLGLKGAPVEQYELTQVEHALSKANLANLYGEAGFLKQGHELAHSVLSAAVDDELAANRARYALEQIATMRKKEKETIDSVPQETREERDFMSAYADAYCSDPIPESRATYSTEHGNLTIQFSEKELRGEGKVTRIPSRGLIALAMIATEGVSATEPKPEIIYLFLKGNVHGRSGTYELRITSNNEVRAASILADSGTTITGLLTVEEGARSIRFLERHDKDIKFTNARRLEGQ